jgi:hypothetical protein
MFGGAWGENSAGQAKNIVAPHTSPDTAREQLNRMRVAAPLANPSRQEPYAVPLVQFCAGDDQQ